MSSPVQQWIRFVIANEFLSHGIPIQIAAELSTNVTEEEFRGAVMTRRDVGDGELAGAPRLGERATASVAGLATEVTKSQEDPEREGNRSHPALWFTEFGRRTAYSLVGTSYA